MSYVNAVFINKQRTRIGTDQKATETNRQTESETALKTEKETAY